MCGVGRSSGTQLQEEARGGAGSVGASCLTVLSVKRGRAGLRGTEWHEGARIILLFKRCAPEHPQRTVNSVEHCA